MKNTRFIGRTLCVAALALLALPFGPSVNAADHIDAPIARGDNAADITDFFAWKDGDKIVAAIAYAGLDTPGSEGTYDRDVLYGIHLDNDGDAAADQSVWIRFGQDDAGDWGVLVEGLPGATGPIIGPVDQELDGGLGLRVFAGLRDDPFFFDFDGFLATLETGDLSFDSGRDFFRGTNVTMIVVEMSIDAAAGGNTDVQLWSTTARRGN